MSEKKMDKQAFRQMCNMLKTNAFFNFEKVSFSWRNESDVNGNPCMMVFGDNVVATFDEFVTAISKHDKVLGEKLRAVGKAHTEFSQHIADRMR